MQQLNKFKAGILGLVLFLSGIASSVSAFDKSTSQEASGIKQTQECVAKKKRLAVVFLVDESSSIKKADPSNRRTDAINRAVAALGRNLFLSGSTDERKIDVLISVFGSEFNVLGASWLSLADDISKISESVDALATRNKEMITDYESGLLGVEREFISYERSNGGSCKILVWLSDGIIDLDNNSVSRKDEDASYKLICEKTGVGARLRNLGVFTFGLGLGGMTSSGDFDQMKKVVEGRDECGGVSTSQVDSPYGVFAEVSSSEVLLQAIDRIFPPPPPPPPPCEVPTGESPCREFKVSVEAPTTVARLLISAPGETSLIELKRPDGSEIVVLKDSNFVDPGSSDIRIESLGVNARIWVDVAGALGEWVLRIKGSGAESASVDIFSEQGPRIVGEVPLSLDRESPAPILVQVADPDLEGISIIKTGETSQSVTKREVSYSLNVKANFGAISTTPRVLPIKNGEFQILLEGNLTEVTAQGNLYIIAQATLDEAVIALRDLVVPVILNWGDDFPKITGVLTASDIDADDNSKIRSTIVLEITGPKDGQGGARFIDKFEAKELPPALSDANPKLIIVDESNIEIAAGETKQIIAYVEPDGETNGVMQVSLVVELTSRDGKRQLVPIEAEIKLFKPFDTTQFFLLLVVMLIIFGAVQAFLVWPAARYVARVKELPVSTRVVVGKLLFTSDGMVIGLDNSVEELVKDNRNVGSTIKSALVTQVRGFTFRGFAGVMYRSLLKPKTVPVFVKRDPDDVDELTIGHQGWRVVAGSNWGAVSPSLSGVWAVSFQISEIRSVAANPTRALNGQLIFLLPERLNPDDPRVLAQLVSELEVKNLRGSALAFVVSMGSSAEASAIPQPTMSERDKGIILSDKMSKSRGENTQRTDKKPDLYN